MLLEKRKPLLGSPASKDQTLVLAGLAFLPSSDELERSSSTGHCHFLCPLQESFLFYGGGSRVLRWCWVNFQCRGVLQFGYSRARAYCARRRCGWGLFGHFYSQLSFLSFFSLSLGDGPIKTEILSQRAVKPKTTNQPNNVLWMLIPDRKRFFTKM